MKITRPPDDIVLLEFIKGELLSPDLVNSVLEWLKHGVGAKDYLEGTRRYLEEANGDIPKALKRIEQIKNSK